VLLGRPRHGVAAVVRVVRVAHGDRGCECAQRQPGTDSRASKSGVGDPPSMLDAGNNNKRKAANGRPLPTWRASQHVSKKSAVAVAIAPAAASAQLARDQRKGRPPISGARPWKREKPRGVSFSIQQKPAMWRLMAKH
jgi:hypothetical protein